jgi:hypothetical protein
MPAKVTLTITARAKQSEPLVFDRHDTLLVGRMEDCQVCLPDDKQISRHHFIMEVNPPDACIRDLGSLHGTYINGKKYGGREKGESPEEGARRQYPTVDVHDGDEIKIGKTIMRVSIIPDEVAAGSVRCQRCGKNVEAEIGPTRRGDYLCNACRRQEVDPGELLIALIQKAQEEHLARERVDIQIPNYEIIDKLGRGGMGDVYLVRHIKDGSKAALKVMISKIAVKGEARERFLREIKVTSLLHHKNVVRLIDSGAVGSIFYFLLEYCNGGAVDKLMEKLGKRLTLDEAGPIMLQALEGLAYLHEKGIVHRDLKPQNILLTGSERNWTAKVADMGLAKQFDQAGFSGMTVTGTIIGSFPFMPREQVLDFKRFEPVSDVWAMGATCYNILTGQVPRNQRRGQDPLEMILNNEIIPLRKRDAQIPIPVAEVIDRALATNIRDRYQTAREFHSALAKALTKV